MDRISCLPDEILFQILSYLSTKESASTSLLSKRFRNLFALSPYLVLEEDKNSYSYTCRSFCDFVDRVLAVSGNSPVKKLSLKYRQNAVESARINLWISNVLSRGALDRLHLDVIANGIARGLTSLPLAVFTCKTLVELKLGRGFVVAMVPENASLPALETLFLDRVQFSNNGDLQFETLLSACHVLEELTILGDSWEHSKWCRTISCPTLQRLTINKGVSHGYGLKSITFDTPSLSYLDYDAEAPDEYPIVNLDNLFEAKLNLRLGFNTRKSNPTNLIKALGNVKFLTLSTFETSETFKSFGEAIPMLNNLSWLSIKTNYDYWQFLPLLLKKSPNLHTLVIEGASWYTSPHDVSDDRARECSSGYSFLMSCPAKVLEITHFWGTIGEFSQVERLLENMPCLELVKVSAMARDEQAKLELALDMLMLPRACKIQLEFFHI